VFLIYAQNHNRFKSKVASVSHQSPAPEKIGSGYWLQIACGSWNLKLISRARNLWHNSNAWRECSRLGRNKVNVKDKPWA